MIARLVYVLLLITLCASAQAKVIHEERSLYRNIIVDETNNVRCMRFVLRQRGTHNQSCIDLKDPQRLVFEYTQKVMLALTLKPEPKRILVVGLGGGSLPMSFHELLPQAEILSLEIDPAVVKAAKQFFSYKENEQVKTETIDARVFIKRAGLKKQQWDLIVLDAFNGDYIPEHLMTQEFLQEVKTILSPDGLVASNTFSTSKLYDHESTTYASVFSHLSMLKNVAGNRVLFAANVPIEWNETPQHIERWQTNLTPYKISIPRLLLERSPPDWNTSARVLTDQYSPANILKHD